MSEETSLTENNEPQVFFIGGLVTVGAIVVGAKLIIDQLSGAINKAIEKGADEVKVLLEEVKADVESLIGDIEKTYQNNLDITLDNLDAFTRGQVERLRSLFNEINSTILGDIDYLDNKLKEQIRNLIENLLSVVKSLESMLNRTIIRAGKTIVYVFNQVLYRIVYVLLPIIAVILIGVALIVYPFVFKGGLPGGVGGFFVILLMLALFSISVALLIPKSRLWFIRRTGLLAEEKWENFDDRPAIMGITPQIFQYTVISELKIWGVNLLKGDNVPSVRIAGIEAKVKLDPAPTYETLVLDVSEGSFKFDQDSATYKVVLYYGVEEGPSGEIEIQAPSKPLPDLVISSFQINPIKPRRKSNVTATIKVTNQGQARADGEFAVEWWPLKGNFAGKRTTTISGLNPGEERTVSWADYAYAVAGEFETEAKVNPDNRTKESNLNNNTKSHDPKITVLELPPDLEVSDFKIVPDPDEFGDSKIYKDRPVRCTFKVRNRGEGPANQNIQWEWEVGTDAGYKETGSIDGGLAIGDEREITITYRYKTVGVNFLSVARVVPLQDESNKDNNSKSTPINVYEVPAPPKPKLVWFQSSGLKYDDGKRPSVLLTNDGRIFEQHDNGDNGLYYLFGRLNSNKDGIDWMVKPGEKYDKGYSPTSSFSPHPAANSLAFVEVHDNGENSLFFHVGRITSESIGWQSKDKGTKIGNGTRPATALVPDRTGIRLGFVLLLSEDRGDLYYRVGELTFNPFKGYVWASWGDPDRYDSGTRNAVAVASPESGRYRLVEIHAGRDGYLWYRIVVFDPSNRNVDWSRPVNQFWDEPKATRPSIAITKDGLVLVTYDRDGKELYWRFGKLEANDTITWYSDPQRYDKGGSPSIATNDNGSVVEVHDDGGDKKDLFYFIGRIVYE